MDQNLKTDAVTSTKTLCGHLAAAQATDLTPAALREARRGVLDWIGCALAGSGHATISTLLEVLSETSGRPQATVFGRKLKLGLLDAPLANGQMGHVLDFDDTHMGGVVLHTSSPVPRGTGRPASSYTSTAMPSIGPWISPAQTGRVGSPPTKQPHRSVPPEIDARWTSALTCS